jgi:hypothetical protein
MRLALAPHQRDQAGNKRGLLNNYICRDTEFRRTIRGREFRISGFYYCQQNHVTHVCAHSGLRMTINSLDGAAEEMGQSGSTTVGWGKRD